MSQHDFEIANQGFPATRADINNAFQAIASNSAGLTEPSTTYAYQTWYDIANNLLKMRNADNDAWVTLASFDQTNDEWEIRSAVIQAVDAAGVKIKTDDGTARVTIADDGEVTFANDVVTSGSLTVNDTFSVEEIIEKITPQTSTTGTINFDCLTQAIENYTADQTANRTINFRGDSSTSLDTVMANDESMTFSIVMKQGSTAYYLNTYQIDGSAVTPKWSGGSAPDAGNASSLDVYTFTIIKTASATFTVLASLTQYA